MVQFISKVEKILAPNVQVARLYSKYLTTHSLEKIIALTTGYVPLVKISTISQFEIFCIFMLQVENSKLRLV